MVLDPQKVLLYKRYLAKAAKRLRDRDLARERLKEQLDALRSMNTDEMRAKIDELERRIVETMQRETTLRSHHEGEDVFHRQLRDRMAELEGRIDKYLVTREQRLARIAEIEDKIAQRLSSKTEQVAALQQEIKHLEALAEDLESESKGTKQLSRIRQRIETLKKDIAVKAAA